MNKATGSRKTVPGPAGTGREAQVVREETPSGRVLWHVTTEGGRETFISTPSSTAAMDEAMVIYAGALKRLARR